MRHLKNYSSEKTGLNDNIKYDGPLKCHVLKKPLMSAVCRESCALIRTWILAAVCWYTAWGGCQEAYAQPALSRADGKLTPKAWIQQYLDMEFPSSAKHFLLYYKANDEDIVLFSFDIAKDDLKHLMDGKGIFPRYGDLVSGGSDFPKQIVRDSGSHFFTQKIATMQNALSASRSRTTPTKPRIVQLWTSEASAGQWAVCVSVISDTGPDMTIAYSGFKMPVAPKETKSYVIIDSRREQMADTDVWQRWSLDEVAYRELTQTIKTRIDVVRYSGSAAERRYVGLTRLGPAPETPWWKPSELRQTRPGDSEPLEFFYDKGPGVTSSLVIGRMDSLFRCYVHTERHVLASDPLDKIWQLLHLELPASASNAYYESASSPAGIVFWMRFDLPRRDFEACLAQTPNLPAYAHFTEDAAVKEYLHTAYRSGAPAWWRPQELSEDIYALRTTNTKELSDLSVGLGRLSVENIRVYIGAFSPW